MFRAALVLSCCLAASAAEKWSVEDVLFQENVSQMEISRDGKKAVWVQSQMDREKGEPVSNLYFRDLAQGFELQMTRGTDGASAPHFSPDGARIAFLTARKPADAPASGGGGAPGDGPTPQVWMFDARGGEPWAVTRLEKGVRSFAWIDNDTLLLAAAEDASLFEQKTKERKDTSNVVEDEQHAPPVRLFRFDLKTRTARRISDNKDRILGVAVSPDGAWAVTTHERSLRYVYDQKIRPATWLHDLKAGTAKQLFADGKLLPRQMTWTPDSKGFYFAAPFSNHPVYLTATVDRMYYYDVAAGTATPAPLDWENGLARGFAVTPTGFVASLANGARPRAAVYTRTAGGYSRAWIDGEHARNLFGLEISADGKTALYFHSSASSPGQWYAARLEGNTLVDAKPFAKVNAGLKEKPIARTELVYWKGAREEQVEGILYYPHGYQAGKKYPLVVMIHGGPHGADYDIFLERWAEPNNLLAQRGAFVLKPNYHGSSDYGLKWAESISGGNYNELEWIDVEKGVDSLIAKGMVDADKLGIMGWSNGSIITIEVTTRTTRYKAASAGAGDVNWISDWGNCQFGHSFDDFYIGTTPLDDPQLYLKKSPLFRMDKVRTPTIIFFGTIDRQVPTEQGWQHFRALQHHGKTDVRFLLFPGEAHGPRKLVHQRRKLEEEMAWFDKHLFATAKPAEEWMKPDSPLAAALKAKSAGRTPETVERGKIEIGRFEVTRAQYAAFDANYKFPAGTERYPVTGIGFEDAKRYCEWLSKTTGAKYRLGTEEEMEKHLKAVKGENTLDAWAGYTVNADDAQKLASLVEGLGAGALLKPAGSFAGQGEDPLFDLGGNAAEWVVTKDGKGKALGGSADRPADAKSAGAPRPDYTGFRVVKQ